jgi:hypothetical protein
MLKLAKEQMIAVRSSLQTVNFKLADVAANEMQLNDNLHVILKQKTGEKQARLFLKLFI